MSGPFCYRYTDLALPGAVLVNELLPAEVRMFLSTCPVRET